MAGRRAEAVLKGLGLRVQELRRAGGETQEEFAARVGMLTPNYAKIEQGRVNPTVRTLVRLADGLGVDVSDLFVLPVNRRSRPGRPRKDAP